MAEKQAGSTESRIYGARRRLAGGGAMWLLAMKCIAVVGALVLLGAALWNAIGSGRQYASLRSGTVAFAYPNREARTVVQWNGGGISDSSVDLSRLHSAVVFIYHSNCSVCALNVVNWSRLRSDLSRASPETRVASLTVENRAVDSVYWSELAAMRIEHWLLRDTARLRAVFAVSVVPTTAIIRDGVVISTVAGVAGPRRREEILRQVASGRAPRAR